MEKDKEPYLQTVHNESFPFHTSPILSKEKINNNVVSKNQLNSLNLLKASFTSCTESQVS